jgi:hypothetical protein
VRGRLGSSIAIVAIRALLLAGSAGALVAAFVVTHRRGPVAAEVDTVYVCPMHAQVTSASPGDCPICRMQLEPTIRGTAPGGVASGKLAPDADGAPASFVLPVGAKIQKFEELGFGKMYEMSREMRAPAWADTREVGQALFYRDEIALLEPHEEALFFPSTNLDDGKPAGIKVARIDEPPKSWDTGSALIRFRATSGAPLTPDQTGWVKFGTKVRPVRAVRSSAVIQSPTGPYVLLVSDDKRTFTKRPIQIGSMLYEHAAVLSGLDVGERIATLNTFGLDAERRFSGRTAP